MLVEITNSPRDYAWGSRTLLATLQGRRASGAPEAEVWFGDHLGSPATVADGSGRSLAEVLTEPDGGPTRLPFLLKLLAAASPLSIQVHPTVEQARDGFAREEAAGLAPDAADRNYRDDSAKPEILVVVSETFEALSGLRPLADTRRLVATLGEPGRPLAERLSRVHDDAAVLRDTIGWLLSGGAAAHVDAIIAAAVVKADESRAEFAGEFAVARRLAGAYPGDPGVVVALLMNHVVLERGQALYNAAGVLHAYLDGLGVELMTASDNVLRGGLTSKHVDVAELVRILDARPGLSAVIEPVRLADRVEIFDAGVAEFALVRVRSAAGPTTTVALSGPAIALVIEGTLDIATADASVSLTPGRAALAVGPELTVSGDGLVYLAEPNPRHAARREGSTAP